MSRRITIATKMDDSALVEEALQELKADFTLKGDTFEIRSANGVRFPYTGASVNTKTGVVGYDEDFKVTREFVVDQLPCQYNKLKVLQNMLRDGHEVVESYVADASTYIEGMEDILDEGDIVIRSFANF